MFKTDSKYVIALGFGLVLVLLIGMAAIGIMQMAEINHKLEMTIEQQSAKTSYVFTMHSSARERAVLLHAMAVTKDWFERDEQFIRFNELATKFSQAREMLLELELSDQEIEIMAKQGKFAAISVPIQEHIVELIKKGKIQEANYLLFRKAIPAQNQVLGQLSELIKLQGEMARSAVKQTVLSSQYAYLLMATLGLAAFFLGITIALMVIRRVSKGEDDLFHEKELAQVTLHSIGDAVITTDIQANVDYVNPVAEQMTGWSAVEAEGQPLSKVFNIIDEQTWEPIDPLRASHIQDGPTHHDSNQSLLLRKDGEEFIIESSSSPIRNRAGFTIGFVLVFRDVTRARFLAQQLSWQASHDVLTGLVNRREFEHQLKQLQESAHTLKKQHALLYMDLDQFKVVNDTCGHVAGDELLRQISTVLTKKLRESDTLARLGGDEFGVLLEGCPLDQAFRIADALRASIQDFRFVWLDKVFEVGVSIGLVAITSDSGDLDSLFSAADEACYTAKDKGRNRVHVYQPDDTDLVQRHGEMQWVSRINRAFDENRLQLYYQRICPLPAQHAHGEHYEILLRMLDEFGNIVPPMAFIPAAERYGIMPNIDRWVIRSLFETQGNYLRGLAKKFTQVAEAHQPFCSINLSGTSFSDEKFLEFVRSEIHKHKIPPQTLCFEITETAAITNLDKASRFMHNLKGLGCRFALDDFGSGMSSFAYLKNLPVDYLKIDGAFVIDMPHDPVDYALVEAINRVGHVLGIRTIAESAESNTILESLKNIGVDYAQGEAIHAPEPLVNFTEMLQSAKK